MKSELKTIDGGHFCKELDLTGKIINNQYLIGAKIGCGAYGIVYNCSEV